MSLAPCLCKCNIIKHSVSYSVVKTQLDFFACLLLNLTVHCYSTAFPCYCNVCTFCRIIVNTFCTDRNNAVNICLLIAPCSFWGGKNRCASFPVRMSEKATKPGYLCLCISIMFFRCVVVRTTFYILLIFVAVCSVFWLFQLSYQYLPSNWLERLL